METVEGRISAETKTPTRSRGAMVLEWAVVLLALTSLTFTVRRLLLIFAGGDPLLMPATTTGCEEEALFSI